MNVEKMIKLYEEKFGNFPFFAFRGFTDEDIIDAIEQSLENGKPIELEDYEADTDY